MSKNRRRRPKHRRRLTGTLQRLQARADTRARAREHLTPVQRVQRALPEACAVRPDTDVRADGVVFRLPVPEGQRPRAALHQALLVLALAGFRAWTTPALDPDFRAWTVWVEFTGRVSAHEDPWAERLSRPVRGDDTWRTPRIPAWAGGEG